MVRRSALALLTWTTVTSLLLIGCDGHGSKKPGGRQAPGTVAAKLVLGAARDFRSRPDGLPGLRSRYGITFRSFTAIDNGAAAIAASLARGRIGVAALSATDPSLTSRHLVVLEDPKGNFAPQNVVPLITSSKATPGVKQVLNLVSARLTTTTLTTLRREVEVTSQDPDVAAQRWLATLGLPHTRPAAGVTIAVGAANVRADVVIADVYADALHGAGAEVAKHLNIGSRQKYLPALRDGSVDLVPEYSGALLHYFATSAAATTSDAVYAALQKVTPTGLTVLDQSSAEDRDAIVVTSATAQKYGLKTIADLAKPPP